MDLHQLRIQAKELKRALAAGERGALERVLDNHPKFAGRPAERAGGRYFTLRDAQVTIARELGFDSWKDLLDRLGSGVRRWPSRSEGTLLGRSIGEAQGLKHGYVGFDHLMLAILNPPLPTPASDVLSELGLTYDAELARVKVQNRRSRKREFKVNPALQSLLGWSQGIAIGLGHTDLRDEHTLLAVLYSDFDRLSLLIDPRRDPGRPGEARSTNPIGVASDPSHTVGTLRTIRVPQQRTATARHQGCGQAIPNWHGAVGHEQVELET